MTEEIEAATTTPTTETPATPTETPVEKKPMTEEEAVALEQKALNIIQQGGNEKGLQNIVMILNRPILDLFLLPLNQQDNLIRKMRPIVTDNKEMIIQFINARLEMQARNAARESVQPEEHHEEAGATPETEPSPVQPAAEGSQ